MKLVRKDDHEIGIVGTLESVPATAYISGGDRGEDGGLHIHYQGGSEICWDAQETKVNDAGLRLFIDENGEEVSEDGIELLDDKARSGMVGAERAQP
jgi:hypothetical protein